MSDITSAIHQGPSGPQLHLRTVRLSVPGSDLRIQRNHDVITIGAIEGNDLQLTDPTVSRRHAEIIRHPEGWILRDLSSTNGTFVGGIRIREVYLGPHRSFRCGKTTIEFEVEDEIVDIQPASTATFHGLVGNSTPVRELFSILERIAPTQLTVLVTGETGTGKELVSRALHTASPRATGPLIVFDCSAVPSQLIESELFGHAKGAFTGAIKARAGVFEQAHGGTLFIDELGELPLELQPVLLRVLEQREVRRVGDRVVRPVDVRVVAATNRDLAQQVEDGTFRRDLYYRLNVVQLSLPPLRDRLDDLPILIENLLTSSDMGRLDDIDDDVISVLSQYHWPGNIRELRNVLLRCSHFATDHRLTLRHLPAIFQSAAAPSRPEQTSTPLPRSDSSLTLKEAKDALVRTFERQYLEDLLRECHGNVSRAARVAGVDRKTIARLMKRHQLRAPVDTP